LLADVRFREFSYRQRAWEKPSRCLRYASCLPAITIPLDPLTATDCSLARLTIRTDGERVMIDGYDGRAIANFTLDFCEGNSRPVTNLALQKIVYFCHVWSLIELDRPLVRHGFEAWEYGPVLPYLYHEFKSYDHLPIVGRATRIDPADGQRRIVRYNFDIQTESLLSEVVGFYSRLPAGELVTLSHAKGGPWHAAWNHGGIVNPGMKIDNFKIQEFYSKVRCPFSVQ